jgi:hypothetical protein
MDSLISDANDQLLASIGYVNTINLILRALEQRSFGAEVDDALHSLRLATDHADKSGRHAKLNLEHVEEANIFASTQK